MKPEKTPQPLREAPAAVVAAYNRLNLKQRAFALALPTAASQAAAAKLAGYSGDFAKKRAFQVAEHVDVKVVTGYLLGASATAAIETTKDSLERQLQELCHIGLADPRELFDDRGRLLPIKEWPEAAARAVSSIESFEEYEGRGEEREATGMVRKIRFHGKIAAIDQVSKIKGYHRPQQIEHKHSGLGSILDEINGAETGPGPAR